MEIEIIEIKFKDIEIHLPESREAVALARKLLDLFQETLGEVKPNNKYHIVSVKSEALAPGTRNVTPIITPLNQPLNQPSTSEGGMLPEDVYKFQECEKFDHSNLPAHKAGKSTYWLSNDAKRVCIEREGYAQGLYVYAAIEDLKYLQDHPDKIFRTLKKFTNHKKYHVTGFVKDVDLSTLSGEQAIPKEQKEPKQQQEEHNEPEEEEENHKPKLEFFQEDTGFDYMAVQPKQVGRTQVYSNNGKMVIKVAREIVLTTEDTIEKLLQYDEKDLTASLRGINSQKQNILRVYLIELKKRLI